MNQPRNLLQESLAAIERLQARVRELEGKVREPIAIVGAGCRFPGANDPQSLWKLLCDRRDMVSDVSPDRWDATRHCDPDHPGKPIPQRAGFLDGLDKFDSQFFAISAREANALDPQHRLLLETAQEAIESAGIATDRLLHSRTGMFVGISTTEYQQMMLGQGLESVDIYAANGGALNTAAGRVAFVFGFEGPVMAVDTACSSSLVAVHLAVQSLRRGECDMALAGGVNVVLQPTGMVLFTKWGLMAPDGACKAFDDTADGFVRAEGCGTIVLKRLSDAIAADDPILAVIRGTAVNSDGKSSGLTVPHGPSQEAVIRTALADARLAPGDIDYIESHGTGTSLGDPIEMEAIGAVMRDGHGPANPVIVGAVKPNLGHGEASAGMAGLIKIVTALQGEAIPPNIHFSTPSRRIDWSSLPVRVPTEPMPWPRREGRPRRAGVSGFGFSGTNAHVILEEAPPRRSTQSGSGRPGLALISARSPQAVRAVAGRYARHLALRPRETLPDVLTTLATGRTHGQRRVAFQAASMDDLRHGLEAVAAGALPDGAAEGVVRVGEAPRVAFLFTGQGSQYAGMGRELYEREPVFRAEIDGCAKLLTGTLDVDLRTLLFPSGTATHDLSETRYTQPALFAFEYALASLWRSFGLTPSAVAGHSVGEFVAACIAGVFSLEDALGLVAARGRLMQALPPGGAMAAIFAREAEVDDAIAGRNNRIAKAAINGPEEIVVSGDKAAVAEVVAAFRARGVETRPLDVSHAFHSPLLEPMLDEFERAASRVTCAAPRISLISGVTGQPFEPGTAPDAAYWRRQAREAVRFADVVETLAGSGAGVLVEIGPQPTLLGLAARATPAAKWSRIASLRRGRPDRDEINRAMRDLHVAGVRLDWSAIADGWGGRRIALPTYPFQRERHWMPEKASRPATAPAGVHGLLGTRIDIAGEPASHVWEADIDLESHPWVGDHRVQGAAIVPATAYIEMAIAAAVETLGDGLVSVCDFTNLKPLVLLPGAQARIQTTLTAADDGYRFAVYSRAVSDRSAAPGAWVQLVSAKLSVARSSKSEAPDIDARTSALRATAKPMPRAEFYARTAELGNQWGPAFQGIEQVWRQDAEAAAEVTVQPEIARAIGQFRFHPALSDACGHALVALTSLAADGQKPAGAFVGGGVDEIRFHRSPPPGRLRAYARLRPRDELADANVVIGDVYVYGEDGALVSETIGARLWYLNEGAAPAPASTGIIYDTAWQPHALDGSRSRACGDGTWLVMGGEDGLADAIAAIRRASGHRCVVAATGADFSVAGDRAALSSANAGHHAALLEAVGRCAAILDLRGCSDDDTSQGALHLLQAMLANPDFAGTRIWLVTSGTQPVGSLGVRATAGAGLWGLGRTLSVEHAGNFGGLVDIDPAASLGVNAQFLAREAAEADREDMVAYRDAERYVPRLVRDTADDSRDARFVPRPDATYLLTGGLGGIALAIASWLAANGARHLVLVARTPLPPRTEWASATFEERTRRRIDAVAALEAAGARVDIAAGDVAEDGFLARLLKQRRERGQPPVAGVFHTAGSLAFVPLARETPAGLSAMASAKIDGALQLERALEGEPVEQLVLFSSSSTVLRSPLLGAYAAANAWLDAFACRRAGQRRPGLSINWGTWGEAGMALEGGRAQSGAMLAGIDVLSSAAALEALGRLMGRRAIRAAVMPVEWSALATAYPLFASDPYLCELVGRNGMAAAGGPTGGISAADILARPQEERQAVLVGYLRSEAARVLGVAADRLEVADPLSAQGFDSLMAVQVKTRIETDLGVSLPIITVLRGPSVEELAGTVAKALAAMSAQDESEMPRADQAGEWEEGSL